MTDNVVFLLIVLMSPLSAVLVFYILNNLKGKKVTETAPTEDLSMAASKENVVIEANAQAKEIVLEAKSQALKIKEDAEVQAKRAQDQVNKLEKDIAIQRTQVETREKELENRARTLKAAKDAI